LRLVNYSVYPDCVCSLLSEMTYCVSSGTLNPTNLFNSYLVQVAQLYAERPRDACSSTVICDWRCRTRPILCQYLWTVRYGNGYTTTLPLEVFTQRNYVANFIRLKLHDFIFLKTQNRFLSHPLGT